MSRKTSESFLANPVSWLKKRIPISLKTRIYALLVKGNDPKWLALKEHKQQKIFVFLAGFYQNLGDMAITLAQVEFIQACFPRALVVPVPSYQTYRAVKTIKRIVSPQDLVTLVGGGNMDENYPSLEDARLFVVKNFPKNRIISFPQTIHFSESPIGQRRMRRSRKIYSHHPRLDVFVRERQSLQRGKSLFPNHPVKLVPDIVLSLVPKVEDVPRHAGMICLRKDQEGVLSPAVHSEIRECLVRQTSLIDVIETDTVSVSIEDCQPETYQQTLLAFWQQLKECRIVITDRLHCMIFCAITETPCLFFDNSNGKLSGVHREWLKDFRFIKPVSGKGIENFELELIRMLDEPLSSIVKPDISDKFDPLRKSLTF